MEFQCILLRRCKWKLHQIGSGTGPGFNEGEFVMEVQRRHVQYPDYLQGLLLLVLHPLVEDQDQEMLGKHSAEFSRVITFTCTQRARELRL